MTKISEEKLRNIFLKVFKGLKEEDFSLDRKQEEYENWDSFAHMNLISEAENEFKVNFEMEEVVSIGSARDMLNMVNKKMENKNTTKMCIRCST